MGSLSPGPFFASEEKAGPLSVVTRPVPGGVSIRSVRLHLVRHAVLDVEFSVQNNLNGVVDMADSFGFVGRSHCTPYYKNEFKETPGKLWLADVKLSMFFSSCRLLLKINL